MSVRATTAGDSIWHAAGLLVDRAPSLEDLRHHRMHLVAARHWRLSGRPVPTALAEEEHAIMMRGWPQRSCCNARGRPTADGSS